MAGGGNAAKIKRVWWEKTQTCTVLGKSLLTLHGSFDN
jgi:hypothetical protein